VFSFSLLVSVATGIVFGLIPAFHASRTDLTTSLRQGGRSVTGAGNRLRSAFVIGEVALSLMLLAGAGLLIRSLLGLESRATGMDVHNVTSMRVFPTQNYTAERRVQFLQTALEKIRSAPGVESAGTSVFLPGTPLISGTSFYVQGRPKPEAGHQLVTQVTSVDPDFFSSMRVRLLKGRLFETRDNVMKGPRTFVVNEAFVRSAFPNEEALGKRITVAMGDDLPGEIVGVVADIRHTGLSETIRPTVYYSYAHLPIGMLHFLVRGPESAVAGAVAALRSVDRELAVAEVKPLSSVFSESVARVRFTTVLLGIFAAVAMTLAIVGLYGVLSYVVTQRTQEIGVRMAIGAQPGAVLWSMLRYGLALTLTGVAAGTVAAAALSRFLETLLFDVKPVDIPTFVAVIVVLVCTALIAAWVPAYRASRVDPMVALRYE
jgi:putative ABC transport system permease protein